MRIEKDSDGNPRIRGASPHFEQLIIDLAQIAQLGQRPKSEYEWVTRALSRNPEVKTAWARLRLFSNYKTWKRYVRSQIESLHP
jgi:hypothetical protein